MNKENIGPDNKHLINLKEINEQIITIRENIYREDKKDPPGHFVDFDLLPVSMLHTYDIERVVYADYSGGNVVRGYDVMTGECIYEDNWSYDTTELFRGYSNCSSYIMTTTPESNYLRVFDIKSKRKLSADPHHRGRVVDLVMAHKENYTITAGVDGYVNIFSNFTFELLRVLKAGNHGIPYSIALIPFEPVLAVGYSDGNILLFNINTGDSILSFRGCKPGYLKSICSSEEHIVVATQNGISAFSLNGELITSISLPFQPGMIKCGIGDLWQHSPRRIANIRRNDPFMTNSIFITTAMGGVYLYDYLESKLIHTIEGHNESITGLIISSDKTLFTCSYDGAIRHYDCVSKKCIRIFYKSDGCRSVSVSNNLKYLGTSGVIDNKAKIVDMITGKITHAIKHQDSIRCVRFGEVDGDEYLFTGSWDRTINQYDVLSGELVRTFNAPGRVCDLLISSPLLFIAFYDRDKNGGFQINDIKTGKLLYISNNHEQKERFSRCVILGIMEEYLFTGGDDGKIYQWNTRTYTIVSIMDCKGSVRNICLDNVRKLLFAGLDESSIMVWDTKNGVLLKTFKSYCSPVSILVITEDYLFAGHENGGVSQYDIRTFNYLKAYNYHSQRIWDMYYNKSNRTLITSCGDGKINFISIDTGKIKGRFYNINKGYLWVTEPDEDNPRGYYWTDQTDRIIIAEAEEQSKDIKIRSNIVAEYHSVYNNRKLVMSKINGEAYFDIFKEKTTRFQNKNEITKLAENTQCKMLGEGSIVRGE
ncbi:MAG: hypothetical protein HUU54_05550 [Ignavibacteriaceae bacterium]|nr:hypothetical protein [Ignavibacteriaceae bacterium]